MLLFGFYLNLQYLGQPVTSFINKNYWENYWVTHPFTTKMDMN